MRIGQVRARHPDHIELAALNRMARGGDVLDAGRVKRRRRVSARTPPANRRGRRGSPMPGIAGLNTLSLSIGRGSR